MARQAGWILFVGTTAGVGLACVAVWCGRPTAFPVLVLAGTAGGGAAAWAVGKPLSPIGAAARTAPEVEKAGRQGYDICFRLESRAKRFVRYAFVARRLGRVVGRLDADFIGAEQRLYTQNVFVAKAHRKRGLAAALLISAAKTTGCAVVATSGRTADGTAYFAGMRPLLKRHGVELRDGPCVVCSPKVVQAP